MQLFPEPVRGPRQLLPRALLPGRRFPSAGAQSWSPALWTAIEEKLRQNTYDVIHVFGGIHVYEFRALVQDRPNIIVPYESYALYLERSLAQASTIPQRLVTRAQLALARHFERWMYRGYDRVVVVSDKDAATLQTLTPSLPVEVIPNGVDLARFTLTGQPPHATTLIFTGNYEYAPNHDAALRLGQTIFPAVQAACPEAQLLLVGNNPPDDLQALAAANPAITVTGRVPDLRPYLEQATVYVSPLRIGAGIKNKILEALAMQTAVVATALSCDGISVTDGREARIADSDEALSAAVVELLRHPAKRERLAANGRRLIEQSYTWASVADRYEALYRDVIASSAP